MGIKKFVLNEKMTLTEEQRKKIKEAAKRPVVFDEDCPELTDEQLSELRRVHQANRNERRKQNVTLRLKPQTIRKAKALGKGYTGILSRIVEDFLDDPAALKKYL